MPHSISRSDACLRLFNKKWGIPLPLIERLICGSVCPERRTMRTR
jgi:hypothetical protein